MNDYDYKIRRRAELKAFLKAPMEEILAQEVKQRVYQQACNTIHDHVRRARASTGKLIERSIVSRCHV